MVEDRARHCPNCFGINVELIKQELCYKRAAKDGELKGKPKLDSTTAIYRCDDCQREFSISVEAD